MSTAPSLTVAERASRVRFRRAMSLMVLTLFLPGSAQMIAGNRRVGWVALRIWGAVVGLGLIAAVMSLADHETGFTLLANTSLLLFVRLLLMVGAIAWVALFMDAWRLGQPLALQQRQRLAIVGVNGFLSLTTAAVMLFGAHVVGVQRDFLITMFGDGASSAAHHGRYNVLLMGGDSGADRWGMRPDSMTVASIDAETGRTVLISLPRNMQNFPFRAGSVMDKQFPEGFNLEGQYLNGVSTWAQDHTTLFKHSERAGVDATVSAVEGITGLKMNPWAMVNLGGFRELVDAVGGVELNVRQPIPVGLPTDSYFHYIDPGTRKLTGQETLWFARARYDSDDYSRMARQKCVMSAMLNQVSPQSALTNFQAIANASSEMVSTSVPGSDVGRLMALAVKAKGQPITTLSLVPPMINTAQPDIALVQRKVKESIARAEGTLKAPVSRKSKRAKQQSVTGGSVGTLKDGYAANESDDLAASC